MKIIDVTRLEPYFNLALEEYLIRQKNEEYFIIYRNDCSIIIGKHQNAMSEINYKYVHKNNIPVIRRLSGGGTVYHDLGNLNFSFIVNGQTGKLSDFPKFTNPIIRFLKKDFGLDVEFDGINSLLVNGLKISGNSEHIYKNRVLHHGTLLFSSSLANLYNALMISTDKYSDNKVKSRRSKVTNISSLIDKPISIIELKNKLCEFISDYYKKSEYVELTNSDIESIEEIATKKYKNWDWNMAYHGDYEFTNSIKIDKDTLKVKLSINSGKISYSQIFWNEKELLDLSQLILNQKHWLADIEQILIDTNIDWDKYNFDLETFLYFLF